MIAGMLLAAAGIALTTRLPGLPDVPILAILLPAAALAARARCAWLRLPACLLLGFAWGCLRGHAMLERTLPAALEGRDVPVRLCIEGLPASVAMRAASITDLDAVRAAIRPTTRILFAETLSNPHLKVADIEALAVIAREAGILLVVDNTFLTPYLLQPLALGADLVIHSATKYLAGHGDALAGVVAGTKPHIDRVRAMLDVLGSCISPFNAWLVMRGVRTLPMRMDAHSRNAAALAGFLAAHPLVTEVRYPGLASHPDHAVARRLVGDPAPGRYGGMMAVRLRGGQATMNAFANALEVCELAVSLGDVYTLFYPLPKRGNLIRVSVGCEDIDRGKVVIPGVRSG